MDEFIIQLLEMFHEAKLKLPSLENIKIDDLKLDQDLNVDFAHNFVNSKSVALDKIVGVPKFYLPTEDKLSDDVIAVLVCEMEMLLAHYNFEFIFPESVSNRMKYDFMVKKWDCKQVFSKYGMVQIETCGFRDDACPFPDACNICEDFEQKVGDKYSSSITKADFSEFMNELVDTAYNRDVLDEFKSVFKKQNNNDFIEGIHNYCHGRCNKCAFSNKCSAHALDKDIAQVVSADYDDNQRMALLMQAINEIVEEELKVCGVDLDMAKGTVQQKEISESREVLKVENSAHAYAKKIKHWLDSNQMEIESRLVLDNSLQLNDSVETVMWYQLFIPSKVERAATVNHKNANDKVLISDSNGSAKAALVAVDESIQAWQIILAALPHKEDGLLQILRGLSKLKNEILEAFPDALSFKRPGFDG